MPKYEGIFEIEELFKDEKFIENFAFHAQRGNKVIVEYEDKDTKPFIVTCDDYKEAEYVYNIITIQLYKTKYKKACLEFSPYIELQMALFKQEFVDKLTEKMNEIQNESTSADDLLKMIENIIPISIDRNIEYEDENNNESYKKIKSIFVTIAFEIQFTDHITRTIELTKEVNSVIESEFILNQIEHSFDPYSIFIEYMEDNELIKNHMSA